MATFMRKSETKGFYRDMSALIEKGFITCSMRCDHAHKVDLSVFEYVAKLRKQKRLRFPPLKMTLAMQRKEQIKKAIAYGKYLLNLCEPKAIRQHRQMQKQVIDLKQ